jgi:hypothetical protein
MELWKLELRKDWPLIVTSIECPRCHAEVAERCHPIEYPHLFRNDFHVERKHAAAEAFLAYQEKDKPNGDHTSETL